MRIKIAIFFNFFVNLTLFGYECCEKCFRFVFLITRDVIIINVFENLSRAKRCSPPRFLTPYAYTIYSRFYTNVLVVKHITTTHSLLTTKFHPTWATLKNPCIVILVLLFDWSVKLHRLQIFEVLHTASQWLRLKQALPAIIKLPRKTYFALNIVLCAS